MRILKKNGKRQNGARCVHYLSEFTTRTRNLKNTGLVRTHRPSKQSAKASIVSCQRCYHVGIHHQHHYFSITSILQFCTTLHLELSFYRSMCYKSRAHYPLLQYLRTTSAILLGTYSYFVVT